MGAKKGHEMSTPTVSPIAGPRKRGARIRKPFVTLKCVMLALAVSLFIAQLTLVMRYRFSTAMDLATISQQIFPAAVVSDNDENRLPKWIENYFRWHKEMRSKYPGTQLFTDPSAPKLLIRTCLGLCGGLNDRLGQLPWDLYLANQTQRVYLIRWERPRPLENFFIPNEIDWSVPEGVEGFGDMKTVRALPALFRDYLEDRPDEEFWETQLDQALERAKKGEFKDTKVLRHRLLGHLEEGRLEDRLRALGETDMIHATKTFGMIFRAFFRPSKGVEAQLSQVYEKLHMSPNHYTAVHCRVRHPKATVKGVTVKGKNANYPADKTGLPWYGETKDFAVAVATHAIQCARTLSVDANEPMYFMSDSNDLVRYVAHELKDKEFVARNTSLFENPYDAAALKAIQPTNIVAREVSLENAHIDKQKGRNAEAYYGTFVDLLLAANARCVTFGIGFYAVFATKISGTECKLLYQEEEWGGKAGGKASDICTEETYQHLN